MMAHRGRFRRLFLLGAVSLTVIAALAGVTLMYASHNAQAHKTVLYVGAAGGSNSGCSSPGYTSVQDAVNQAASGDTVYLCASGSPYVGQVIVNKTLTLTGDRGATIQAPATWPANPNLPPEFAVDHLIHPEAILLVWGPGVSASVNGLTISGPFADAGIGCYPMTYGVLVIANASIAMDGDAVLNATDANTALAGCQHGVGIQIGKDNFYTVDPLTGAPNGGSVSEAFAAHAVITNTTVAGYQKNGIDVADSGSTGDIRGNTVTGAGIDTVYSPIIAQNGIEFIYGASGQIRDNTVSGNQYTGPAYASDAGILIFGGCGSAYVTGVQVMGNTLVNNDVGIDSANYADDCFNPAPISTNMKIVGNTISNGAVTNVGNGNCCGFPYVGYQAGIADAGTNDKIINNTITGAGYAAQQVQGGPFVLPIDTISTPDNRPKIHANDILV